MKLLSDLLPILLFFITYKMFGMYQAIAVAMIVTVLQSAFLKIKNKKLDNMNKMMLVLVLLLGSASLILHNEYFFKWKPTAINWGFGLAFLGSHFIGKKTLLQRMMDTEIRLPDVIWKRLSFAWISFFFFMGCANIFVVYHFDTNTWVNFKLFGVLGLTLLFALLQSFYLARHAEFNED